MSFSSPTGISAPRANISGYKLRSVPNFTPAQMQLFSQLGAGASGQGITSGLDYLNKLASGSEEGFNELEAPSYRGFEKTLGQIGTRFSGLGARDSSAFQNAVSGAAGDLAQNLGSQRMQIRQNALDSLLDLSERLLGKTPYQSLYEKNRTGFDKVGDILSLVSKFSSLL